MNLKNIINNKKMNFKNILDGKRMFELESHLSVNKDLNPEILNESEQEYIKIAKAIPLKDIIEAINYYRKNFLKIDEIEFIDKLSKIYDDQSKENLRLRFKQAHAIMKYCSKELKMHAKEQKKLLKRNGSLPRF